MKTIFILFLLFVGFVSFGQVKIYEFYGAGGNSGAVYNADYAVLVNTGATSVNLAGWSVQYASSSGTSWDPITLSGTIQGGFGFFLIKLSNVSATNGISLPTPDVSSTTINAAATNGKFVLMNTSTTIPPGTSDPQGLAGIVDFIGYGSANAAEGGNANTAPSPSSTTAIRRKNTNPSADTDNNAFDFGVVTPNPLNSGSPLPVTLTSFKASTLGQEVILDWKTTDESNFSHFSVERSYDAKSFEAIGRIDAKAKLTTDKTTYQFVDQTPNFGLNYYRLKKVDIDGTSDYSRIITANMTETSPIVIYPNPSADFIRIKNGEKEAIKSYEIYNISGRLIRQNESTATEIKIQDLPSGMYFLQLKNERNALINRRFIKI